MSVGQTEKALTQIESSTSTQALALKSVIFSSRNQSEKALDYSQKAVQQDSQSSAALLALSYAHQAALNLPEALQAAHQATLLEENNAIAWARVSEMELAMGNIRQADKAIAHAQQKQPDSAYVITQAGFIKLFNIRIDSAKALFKQAIALDSENPQAHLGLGLALLRQGELKQGREQLEYATSLDPAHSVVRSYLGRAYFEEKRDEEAGTQWALAKQLDPNDPTPYFYEGVRKLYANDPIGAIEELETSRKLNDERALYRSETLLQSDAASRSATLARAYDDVGYDQGVLLSGWDALKNDPTSSEGHRLLADYYRGNSRYETARASELLQSQLWQPLSAYPLQPQLSETGISVVEGSGPQNPGFNEYHSLFTQDGVYGSVTGYGGSDGTWGDDLVGSFLAGPVAVSLGQYHFETDGWRDNSDQEQDIYNGFVQWQVSTSTGMQFEYSKFEWDRDDLTPDIPFLVSSLSGQTSVNRDSYRLGFRHAVSGNSTLIVSLIKQDSDEFRQEDLELSELSLYEEVLQDNSSAAEVQFAVGESDFSYVLGGGVTHIDRRVSSLSSFRLEALPFVFELFDSAFGGFDRESNFAYVLFNYNFDRLIDLELGLGFERLHMDGTWELSSEEVTSFDGFGVIDALASNELVDIKETVIKYTPKMGVSWKIDNVLFQTALFRRVQRFYATDRTIEPTMLAGFTQLFNDPDWTVSDNFGMALSSGGSANTWYVQYVKRELDYGVYVSDGVESTDVENDIFSASVMFFSPDRETSANLGINWDRTSNETSDLFDVGLFDVLELFEVPIVFKFYAMSKVSFSFEQTYYKQRLVIDTISSTEKQSGWSTDVAVEYRLPKRAGIASLGVNNLLGNTKEFVNYDASLLRVYPDRFWYASINFSF